MLTLLVFVLKHLKIENKALHTVIESGGLCAVSFPSTQKKGRREKRGGGTKSGRSFSPTLAQVEGRRVFRAACSIPFAPKHISQVQQQFPSVQGNLEAFIFAV